MDLALFTKLEVTGSDALGVNFVTALDFSVNLSIDDEFDDAFWHQNARNCSEILKGKNQSE